jgi:hypothetical protein
MPLPRGPVRMKGHVKFALVAGFCFVPPLVAMQLNSRAARRWREVKDDAGAWLSNFGRERGGDVFPGSGLGGGGGASVVTEGSAAAPTGAAAAAAAPRYASSGAVALK